MTGQYHWRLEEAANLHSTLRTKFPSYSELLHEAGYAIGHSRKAWGPGKIDVGGRRRIRPDLFQGIRTVPATAAGRHAVLLLVRFARSAPAV